MKAFERRGRPILRRLCHGARMAEVGVLVGALSEFILRSRADVHLIMVDSWAPASEQPERYKATGDLHAHHDAARCALHRREAEARAAMFPDRATVLPMTSLAAPAQIEDGSLDLVFLDADHSYEGVRTDIAAWAPKVKAGGILGGHDYRNPEPGFDFSGVERAVLEWVAGRPVEEDDNFTWFVRC